MNWILGSLTTQEYITEDNVRHLQVMRQDIYHQYTIAVTTKTWPMKMHLDKLILEYVQSGMLQYLEHQVIPSILLTIMLGECRWN